MLVEIKYQLKQKQKNRNKTRKLDRFCDESKLPTNNAKMKIRYVYFLPKNSSIHKSIVTTIDIYFSIMYLKKLAIRLK